MIRYEHTQRGTVILAALGTAGLVCVIATLVAALPVLTLAVAAVLGAIAVLFRSLTVTIDGTDLEVRFGSGPIRRRIPLADIEEATPVRNRAWYGWGIRLTPGGWMFNVAGLDAVQLRLRGGRKFRIGTDDPEGLARALAEATGGPA